MAEISETNAPDPEKEGKIIWCGKRNKVQKQLDEEACRFFLSIFVILKILLVLFINDYFLYYFCSPCKR